MMPTYTDTIRMLSPPKRGYGPSPRKGESAPPCCLGGLPAAPPPPLPPLPPPPPRAGRPPAAGRLGIGLARRDGEVGNAEGADVIGHDADLRTGRGFVPNVTDLLPVDDEARRAGQLDHADAVGAIQLGHIGHRGDVAALVALQAEQGVFLSAVSSSRHRLLLARLFSTTPIEALGFGDLTTTFTSVTRPDSGAGPTFIYSVCSLPGVEVLRSVNQPSSTPAVQPCSICCWTAPANGPSCCWYWARAGVLKAPTMESRAMPRRRIRSL